MPGPGWIEDTEHTENYPLDSRLAEEVMGGCIFLWLALVGVSGPPSSKSKRWRSVLGHCNHGIIRCSWWFSY